MIITKLDYPGATAITATKDSELVYTHMCEQGAVLAGFAPGERYHPDMRWTVEDITHWDPVIAEHAQCEEKTILQTGRASHSISTVRDANNVWKCIRNFKQRTADGGILSTIRAYDVTLLFNGWPARLDNENECLRLSNGVELSRTDLTLLHQLLLNLPRKIMARRFYVSVKAIEKRLTRLREKLKGPHCCPTCYSIQHCLNMLGLSEFLLAQPDWFAPVATYTVLHR